ncbi:DUF6677 family protein [Paenibacillus tarimensis]
MTTASYRSGRRFIAGLFAFLVPGAGHIVLGRWDKGVLLFCLSVLDLLAIVYYANSAEVRHIMMIVYLGLALPSIYFYSVYDALQILTASAASKRRESSGRAVPVLKGISLASVGLFMLLFVHPPAMLRPWLELAGDYSPPFGLFFIGIWLLWRLAKGSVRLGRFTAALFIIFVGALLLRDQWIEARSLLLLDLWWPMIVVLFGLELAFFAVRFRPVKRLLSVDIVGLTIAMLFASAAYAVTQLSDIPIRWLDQFTQDATELTGYTEEKGYRYVREPLSVSPPDEVQSIEIFNPNGQVHVRTGTGEEIRIETIVWIDLADKAAADKAAGKADVHIEQDGSSIIIEGRGEPYGEAQNLKPRINMIIVLPARYGDLLDAKRSRPDMTLKIKTISGMVNVHETVVLGGLTLDTTRGRLSVQRVKAGSLRAKTRNGNIRLSDIDGPAKLNTVNGNIKAYKVTGEVTASAANGAIEAADMDGDVTAVTKNGSIRIAEARSAVKADTLNGAIEVLSSHVGGEWNIDSAIGDIRLTVPGTSDITVNGSVTFGTISTNLPLLIDDRTITGTLGDGTYPIRINANSSIVLENFQP